MHFISSNLLHNFPNGKYMLFYLLKKKIHVKNTGQPDPQPDWSKPLFNPLKMTCFDQWLDWPNPNPTRLTCFAMSSYCPHCVAHFIFFPMLSSPSLTKFNHSQSHCTLYFSKDDHGSNCCVLQANRMSKFSFPTSWPPPNFLLWWCSSQFGAACEEADEGYQAL